MRNHPRSVAASPSRVSKIWLGGFLFWGFMLTGALHGVLGSPGAIQAIRLRELLASKQAQVEATQRQVHALEEEHARLETSRVLQQREIRRVLGYAAPDEIIFDFSDAAKL